MDDAMDDFLGDDIADEDLEAELNALMGGHDVRAARTPKGSSPAPPSRGPGSKQTIQGRQARKFN